MESQDVGKDCTEPLIGSGERRSIIWSRTENRGALNTGALGVERAEWCHTVFRGGASASCVQTGTAGNPS